MRALLKSLALTVACAWCFNAGAENQAEPTVLQRVLLQLEYGPQLQIGRELKNEDLAEQRGRMAVPVAVPPPAGTQPLGVILWDEPQGGSHAPSAGSQHGASSSISAGGMVLRR